MRYKYKSFKVLANKCVLGEKFDVVYLKWKNFYIAWKFETPLACFHVVFSIPPILCPTFLGHPFSFFENRKKCWKKM